jgi:hypothetical protein
MQGNAVARFFQLSSPCRLIVESGAGCVSSSVSHQLICRDRARVQMYERGVCGSDHRWLVAIVVVRRQWHDVSRCHSSMMSVAR